MNCRIGGYDYFGVVDWFANGIRHAAVNYTIFLIEVIRNVISDLQPREVLVIEHSQDSRGWALEKNQHYHDKLIPLICDVEEVKINVIGKTTPQRLVEGNRKTWLKKSPAIFRSEKYQYKEMLIVVPSEEYGGRFRQVVQDLTKEKPSSLVVLIGSQPLSMAVRLRNLRDGVQYLDPVSLEGLNNGEHEIDLDFSSILEKLPNLMNFRGIQYWKIVSNKILQGVIPSTRDLAVHTERLMAIFDRISPSLVMSTSSRGKTYTLGEVCRHRNVAGICIPHGSVVRPKNKWDVIANRNIGKAVILNRYPMVAVQTPETKKYLEVFPTESRQIITGPLVFTECYRAERKKNKLSKILHAVTVKPRSSMKFWGVETTDELIQSLNDIISVVKAIEDFTLVIKLHPICLSILSREEWGSVFPEGKSVSISTRPLNKELLDTDVLISYSSTVIEEALINRIPVVLYDKWNRYRHLDACVPTAGGLKPAAVYYINNQPELMNSLSAIADEENVKKISNWGDYRYSDSVKVGFSRFIEELSAEEK